MKNSRKVLAGLCLAAATVLVPTGSEAQTQLPDGSVIYSDGSRRLPDGTVVYPDGRTVNKQKRKTVVLPDGTIGYPNTRQRDGKRLPPGQAKKIYGGSAKDYAPGQQKKRNRNEKVDVGIFGGKDKKKGKHSRF